MLLATLALSAFAGTRADLSLTDTAKKPPAQVDVYVPQQIINPGDAVYDGSTLLVNSAGTGKLIWVDLDPDAAFPHDSYYLLVWPEGGLDVYKGHGQPYVGGFFGSWTVWGQSWTSEMPDELPGPVGTAITEIYGSDEVLPAGTVMTDGQTGSLMVVDDNAYYIWVDTDVDAKFTHPTWHIFIEADGELQTIEGDWFPVLGGDVYLYGDEYKVDYPITVSE